MFFVRRLTQDRLMEPSVMVLLADSGDQGDTAADTMMDHVGKRGLGRHVKQKR